MLRRMGVVCLCLLVCAALAACSREAESTFVGEIVAIQDKAAMIAVEAGQPMGKSGRCAAARRGKLEARRSGRSRIQRRYHGKRPTAGKNFVCQKNKLNKSEKHLSKSGAFRIISSE